MCQRQKPQSIIAISLLTVITFFLSFSLVTVSDTMADGAGGGIVPPDGPGDRGDTTGGSSSVNDPIEHDQNEPDINLLFVIMNTLLAI